MSQNINIGSGFLDSFVKVLTQTNAIIPAAAPGVAMAVEIFKSGMDTGKTLAEMEAEAIDSMSTALRTREKAEKQMSDEP